MLVDGQDSGKPATGPHEVVREAVERWRACKDWQGIEDERAREDIKFANGDARNNWQWDKAIYDVRDGRDLPCLTINSTRVHNDIIINQMSKDGYGIKIRPTGGKASYKSAQVMQNVIRRIEYVSKATTQYRKVGEQQVDGGIGYILIETAYVSNKTRDQEIYLKASRDPTGVYLDPWIREPDGSDANFGFVFERMPRQEFNRKYPLYKNRVGTSPLDNSFADWLSDKEIMLAKYYRKKQQPDTFVWYEIDNGDNEPPTTFEGLASEIKDDAGIEIYKMLMSDIRKDNIVGGTRKVFNDAVEWFLIAGDQIIESGDWAGKYIPICRCVGRELVIDNTLDRKGHTRPMINANQMLNYNASTAVYIVALQPTASYVAPARAIEGQEQYKTMNINSFPVLLYNDIDDEAPEGLQKIDAPVRQDPPKPSMAHEQGMATAERQMMMISGQYQSQIEEVDKRNPSSGAAINERKEQGDTATYHFVEHMGDMKRFIGVQLLDLIPKIYDTKRTLHIIDDAGEKSWIAIDPNQADAVQELEHDKEDEEAVKLAFNPAIGEYECISDPGPDYATQRREGWDAIKMILQANNELVGVAGDLLFKYGDFPGADAIQERLQREIKASKPYLFDTEAEPQLIAAQEQNKRLTALNAELITKLADEKLKSKGYNEKRDIDAFKAETDRMKAMIDAMAKMVLTPQQQAQMQHEVALQAHDDIFSLVREANQEVIDREDAEAEAGQ
jgi:hypothetical protein